MNPQKSLNASLKSMDCSSINKNQLNSSSSKMQYSFPKTYRFSEEKKSFSPNKYYELPTTKTDRATSFGYGNKLDLSKRNFVTPPPDRYNLDSEFKEHGKQGLTMAAGRNDIKANDMFYRGLKQCPEPATYSPKGIDGSLKYSIHPRLQDKSDKWIKCVPGPGNYSYLDLTQKQKSPVAKHYSVTSGKFDRLPRLSEVETRNNKNPGPNEYKNTAQILNTLKYVKKGGNVFTHSARQGIARKSITPGPGNYNSFSEFA